IAKASRQPNQALVPVAFHAIATLPVQYPAATHSTHTMKCNAIPPRVYSSPYNHFRRGGRSAATNAGSTTGLYAGRPARCRAVLWLPALYGHHRGHTEHTETGAQSALLLASERQSSTRNGRDVITAEKRQQHSTAKSGFFTNRWFSGPPRIRLDGAARG